MRDCDQNNTILRESTNLMETKKTWENAPSALIPSIRLSHCPFVRISNESLPTSAEIYAYTAANVVPPETAHL